MTEKASTAGAAPRGLFGRSRARSSEPVETPPRPRSINWALIAIGVVIACVLLGSLTWFIFRSQLINLLIDSNKKASHPTAGYDATKAGSDLNNIRKGQAIQAGVISLALVFLAYALTRARSASAGRWGLIIVLVLTGNGFIPIKGLPGLANILRGFALIGGVTVIGLMFVRSSRTYFAECRGAVTGEDPGARSFGFRGMFSNGMPQRNASRSTKAEPTVVAAGEAPRPAGSKSRTKTRSDQAAVARGAELARTRAKAASKSRRSEG